MVKRLLQVLYAVVLVHVLWALFSLMIDRPLFPTPWAVYANLPRLFEQDLWLNIWASAYRLGGSLFFATIIGVFLGICSVRYKRVGKLLDPLIYLLYPIPKIAFLPVIMLLFGLGELSKIIMITLIIVFQITIGVRDAVKQIPQDMYRVLDVLAASRLQTFVNVTWPASLAGFFSALKIALGTAIATLFFTEMYGTQYGMGYYIMDQWNRLDYLAMFGGIIILSAFSFALFALISVIEHYFLRWQV